MDCNITPIILAAGLLTSLCGCAALPYPANPDTSRSAIVKEHFGTAPDGQNVDLYTLTNRNGLTLRITNYGCIVTQLLLPDRNGKLADVVLGFDNLKSYIKESPYFGAIVGRCANRIAHGEFTLNGKTYHLAKNDGPNSLHGGKIGFDKHVWHAEPLETSDGPALQLTYTSPDGEEGYPGTLHARILYTLTDNNELKIQMSATTDKPTPVNLASHSYFNLAGHDSGTVLKQVLTLNANRYTPTDSTLIPTGELKPVAHTPYDFTHPKPIGQDIDQLPPNPATHNPGGYDINFVLNGPANALHLAANAYDPASGRRMQLFTDQPGLQFYTGNFLDGSIHGKSGAVYQKHDAFCLETQKFPDAIHHQSDPNWPSVILRPGQTYTHEMLYKFTAE